MTDTRTLTLTEFLDARLAEDKTAARAASVKTGGAWGSYVDIAWGPRAVREAEAKRTIIRVLLAAAARGPDGSYNPSDVALVDGLAALASVYSDHLDYRQDW